MIKQLLNSVIAKYRDLSVSRRSIICLSLRLRQIIDLLATDKSRYFAQPRPIIVNYFSHNIPIFLSLTNWSLPSSKNPHFQNETKCTTFHVKMSFIRMRMKIISISKAKHLTSFWYGGLGELGNGPFMAQWSLHSGETLGTRASVPWIEESLQQR